LNQDAGKARTKSFAQLPILIALALKFSSPMRTPKKFPARRKSCIYDGADEGARARLRA
jgi:hypothetical protein